MATQKRRRDKIPTTQNLNNVALYYLSRYAASEFSLRRVLENRVYRAARRNPQFASDHAAQDQLRAEINFIIDKHRKAGVLNDQAYAELKVAGLRRVGRSARAIKQRLINKGIAAPLVTDALNRNAEEEETEDAELKAATIFARRRKFGPFGKGKKDFEQKRKELAALARAGFSMNVARKVLENSSEGKAGPFD